MTDTLTIDGTDIVVIEAQGAVVLLEVAQQGPVGPAGVSGTDGADGADGAPGTPGAPGGVLVQRAAGEPISALQVVWEDSNSTIWVLDHHSPDIFSVLGVTVSAGGVGSMLTVQLGGVMDDSFWSWVPGQRVYLGTTGGLTQTPANDGFHVLIGTALSATRVNLKVQDPIEMI